MIARAGGISRLITLVRVGDDVQKEKVASALWSLAMSDENQKLIGDAGGIPLLVTLARHGNDNRKENSVAALTYLSAPAIHR